MSARRLILVLAASLFPAALALGGDNAVPRGGGGGGSSSGGGGGHPSVHSSGGGSSSSGGSGGSYTPSESPSRGRSSAETRHPRAGTGSGGRYGHGGYYPYYPHYGYGYPGWGWGYWWPYGAYGWYGGYWGGGGSVYHYVQNEVGSVRVLVDPSEARVYVDGYYAGTVDDFDGLFQRLSIPRGRHEITLKLEGYKSHRMNVYIAPDRTLKLRYTMERGTGETFEDMAGNVPEERREPPAAREQSDRLPSSASGTLELNVKPSDASVYVDGAFRGTGREASSIEVPAGRHRIEVVRPGYRTVDREVEVAPDDRTEISITLEEGSI